MLEMDDDLKANMNALVILSCRPNSHQFQERQITLNEEPEKIGRSVARAKPSDSNGIFECKVLSRHHAMAWYKNHKFFIQDTKSSNGTFINNQRLSKTGEDSQVREIFSGDLLQFGVEVMETNCRGEKITYGCIIATVNLFHPDGKEAKPQQEFNTSGSPGIVIQSQDIYELAHLLEEALHRKKMMDLKLSSLHHLVQSTQESCDSGWQALIGEDLLLSRVEMLESQLHIYSKNHSEDVLRQELTTFYEDKIRYETTAKESLRRVLEEKLEAVTKLSDLKISLESAENECSCLDEVCKKREDELKRLAVQCQDQLQQAQYLQGKLQETERSYDIELERVGNEKQELLETLDDMSHQQTSLSAKIEALEADNDFSNEQLIAMKAKLESSKDVNMLLPKSTDVDSSNLSPDNTIPLIEDGLPVKPEGMLSQSDGHLNKVVEHALDSLKAQLDESKNWKTNDDRLTSSLRDFIQRIEGQFALCKSTAAHVSRNGLDMEEQAFASAAECDFCSTATSSVVNGHQTESRLEDSDLFCSMPPTGTASSDSVDVPNQEQEMLQKYEADLTKCKDELRDVNIMLQKSYHDLDEYKMKFFEAQQMANEKVQLVQDLQAEMATTDIKQEIFSLQEELDNVYCQRKQADSELEKTKSEFQDLKDECSDLHRRIQANEVEIKMSLEEKLQLSSDYKKLQQSCKQLEAVKPGVEIVQVSSRLSLTDMQDTGVDTEELTEMVESSSGLLSSSARVTDVLAAEQTLQSTLDEVNLLRSKCQDFSQQVASLNTSLHSMEVDYSILLNRFKKISFVSSLPILVLIFAILMAFYPLLELFSDAQS